VPWRVNHVAIASGQYALDGRFYESLFIASEHVRYGRMVRETGVQVE
jgi:hypothetical protein